VGASVGATLGSAFVASLLSLLFVLWCQRRRQGQTQTHFTATSQTQSVMGPIGPAEMESIPAKYSNLPEVDSRQVTRNIPA